MLNVEEKSRKFEIENEDVEICVEIKIKDGRTIHKFKCEGMVGCFYGPKDITDPEGNDMDDPGWGKVVALSNKLTPPEIGISLIDLRKTVDEILHAIAKKAIKDLTDAFDAGDLSKLFSEDDEHDNGVN